MEEHDCHTAAVEGRNGNLQPDIENQESKYSLLGDRFALGKAVGCEGALFQVSKVYGCQGYLHSKQWGEYWCIEMQLQLDKQAVKNVLEKEVDHGQEFLLGWHNKDEGGPNLQALHQHARIDFEQLSM